MQEKYSPFEPYPISEYRNNNTALCSERAAVAQNLLAFLGADTYFFMGHLSRNDGMANMHHSYNCIVDREYGSGMIVDFTNPILREQTGERHITHSDIINKLFIAKILSGDSSVELSRPEFFMQDGKEMRRTSQFAYSLNALTRSEILTLQSKPTQIDSPEISVTEVGKGVLEELGQTEELDYTQAALRKHQKLLKEQQDKQQGE